MVQPVPHEILGGPDSRFVCPLVMDAFRKRQETHTMCSRYRTLSFRSVSRSPVEILAEAHDRVKKPLTEYIAQSIMFDTNTTVVARSASVIDWANPTKKLPWGGLKLFEARIETGWGDRLDIKSSSGELFWGTGSRPAVITGGIAFGPGASLVVYCTPLIPDLEVKLGFWTVEHHQIRGQY